MPEREKSLAEQFGSRVGGVLQGASNFVSMPARGLAGAAESGRGAVADFTRGVANPQQPFTGAQTARADTPGSQQGGAMPGAPDTAFRGGQGHTG
ncbi:MAG TPA: hypothetical protein VK972_02595, partial [Wenzhouxiangella sp.]|nr:hypothetical protein [Wenzhouxiangella sp.]